MKLEITKEKVLEAASKCETAKQTLKTLFPEVFEDYGYTALLEKWLNTEAGYDLFRRIPGKLSYEKAKTIVALIQKTYPKK